MLMQIDQPTLVLAAQHQHKTANKRLISRLRAAEARHRIELLREEQVLHQHLTDVWDENFVARPLHAS
ncbi:hypothetical protein N9235_03455 [Gammaproteobacteria bacterium]|nr:hypothetical protein [Gammaproteobacteria bacterium]